MPYLVGEVLGRDAHVDVVEGVRESVVDHRVDELGVAHAGAEARARQQVGRARHVLHAAGDDDVDVARADHLGGDRDRLQARSAQHVDRRRGHLLRDPSGDRGLARRVLPEARLQHAAEYDLLHLVAGDPRPLERRAHRVRTQLGRGDVLEVAAETADGRPHRTDDDRIFHGRVLTLAFDADRGAVDTPRRPEVGAGSAPRRSSEAKHDDATTAQPGSRTSQQPRVDPNPNGRGSKFLTAEGLLLGEAYSTGFVTTNPGVLLTSG